jgi:preprotein translocase subunit Sss1
MVFLGLLFLFLGRRIWKKEQITLIHSYHYKKVSKENKKDYTEEIGKSIIIIGIGMLATGIIDYITKMVYGWLFLTIFFILGFIKIFKAQKKYNDGMF